MTVFFDHQAFCIQEYGGLSRYYTELITGLHQSHSVTPLLPLRYTNNQHLRDAGLHNRPFFPNFQFRGKIRLLCALNRRHDIAQISSQPFDIFHATYYDPYFLPSLNSLSRKVPVVVTFLDMIHERLGHQFPYLAQDKAIVQHKRLLAQRADRLIAVSESTKRDMVEILNVDPAKIDVIYHGSSFIVPCNSTDVPEVLSDKTPYLLFVGMRRGYKNFDWMLRAIAPLLKRENIRLVCAGGDPLAADERQLIYDLGLSKLVTQQIVTDRQLQQLYQHAVAFVFPSLYEGFGIPILEAMACGCPCIINDNSSLPEIGGNAALCMDVNRPDSLMALIERLMTNSAYREHLISCGLARIDSFQWSTAVRQHELLYERTTATVE